MAVKSLGVLKLDLIAETGGFERGMNRAERRSANFKRKVSRQMRAASGAVAALGTGAATAGLVGLADRQAEAAQQADQLARTLGTTAGKVQEFQYAAEQAGIGADKAADIFKDLTEKIGDASLTGGGELADVLDRIGISAETLQQQDPTQQLLTISQAIQGLPRAQQVNVLESIADDGSRLLPLLDDGAEGLRRYADQARRFGVALSSVDNQRLVDAHRNMQELRGLAEGVSNQFAIAMSPAIQEAAGHADELALVFKDENFKQGVTVITSAAGGMATSFAEAVAEVGKLASAIERIDLGEIGQFLSSRTLPGYIYGKITGGEGQGQPADGQGQPAIAAPAPGPAPVTQIQAPQTEAINAATRATEQQTRALTDQEQAQRALDSAFESRRDGLAQQIALYGDTTRAARTAYEVEQGALKGISAERQIQLVGMARQLDQLKQQKDAVRELFPEWQRLQRAQQAQDAVGALPDGMQAYGQQRADQMARDAATQGLPGMNGLDPQYGGAFAEANRLGGERDQFESEYQRRREAFQRYAEQHQADKRTANAAIEALDQAHGQRMLQYDRQINAARLAGSAATLDNMAQLTRGFAGENNAIYQGLFATAKAFSVAKSALAVFDAISSAMSLPFPANLAAAGTAAAHATKLLSGVSAVEMATGGMVNGPGTSTSDSIPAWLSDGEAVINARAVDRVGPEFIHALNSGQMPSLATGGVVKKSPAPPAGGASRGGQTIVNIENHTSAKPKTSKRQDNQGNDIIEIFLTEVESDVLGGGRVGQAVLKTTDAGRRLVG